MSIVYATTSLSFWIPLARLSQLNGSSIPTIYSTKFTSYYNEFIVASTIQVVSASYTGDPGTVSRLLIAKVVVQESSTSVILDTTTKQW